MKKLIKKILLYFTSFLILLVVSIGSYSLYEIMCSNYITEEDVYKNSEKMKEYGLKSITTPINYGFSYEEKKFDYKNKKYYGWYIPEELNKSDKALLMVHGRGTNRLVLLEYLELLKEKKIVDEYSIFLPDMRNSGKSDKAFTKLGIGYSEDVFAAIKYLNKNYNKKKFVIYAFSMGAMGTVLMDYNYEKQLKDMGIEIEKIILDSPLSNSEKAIVRGTEEIPFMLPFKWVAPLSFNIAVKGKLNKLKLSYLLGEIKSKILILQSLEDTITPYKMLEDELNELNEKEKENILLHIFDKGKHVTVYRNNKKEYSEIVEAFLKK